MSHAWSLAQYDGQWHEDQRCQRPIISDTKFAVDIEDSEGCAFTLTTESKDGVIYRGSYKYKEEDNPPGTVVFERFKSSRGSVFIGDWKDDSSKGKWIIQTW